MTFINPKTDFAFKKIFGSKKSKDILISFLNAILYEGQNTILDLEVLDPYQAPRIQGIKDSYLDVKATITDNKTVIIEMQVLNVLGFEKRVLYNAAKAFSIQLSTGEDYTLLNPVIALTITDFEMFEGGSKVISRYRLKEKDDLTDYSDDIELVFVELPKFNKKLEELETLTDKWIYFLKSANQLKSVPESMDEVPAIHQAFEIARQSRLSRRELELLEKREMFLHDNRNAILKAEQMGMKRGMEKGMKKGMEKGIEKGIELGREEGRKQQAIAIARSLLDVLDIETISQKTGLSPTEIQQLR
ncbi:Rpn family recombination-promoting nuclease/putative transposase [Kovacikia minuta CCNUW1]|uniref:Rpn family recombination-promoting nuclease/putative transposase n=1 Tax=Kovacikia minuta TaxID=2931930 RepID=UPI001CC9ABCA|nr:Rpn family recombination-promoting nuclease/putative transposase [Kovacikia minuta]UBF26873.1 Rpn family recombination-promoting nuclease/putative transposase [Kovacikia minuta CCNUW1]